MLSAQRILCPTDFSACSQRALSLAYALAKESDAEVHIVHAYEELLASSDGDELGLVPPADLDEVRRDLHRLRPRDTQVRFRHELIIGDPSQELVNYAEQHAVDMIVMGTHGRTGLERVLMGSVAESVLRHAACPVLTVKEPLSSQVETA